MTPESRGFSAATPIRTNAADKKMNRRLELMLFFNAQSQQLKAVLTTLKEDERVRLLPKSGRRRLASAANATKKVSTLVRLPLFRWQAVLIFCLITRANLVLYRSWHKGQRTAICLDSPT